MGAALEAQVHKSPLSVEFGVNGTGRYPPEVEAAVYFCVLEAMQNVTKYANTSGARISLAESNGYLTFLVEDDGVGFDPWRARGAGLANMRDRMEALGGGVVVLSSAAAGTVVRGRVPVRPQGDAASS